MIKRQFTAAMLCLMSVIAMQAVTFNVRVPDGTKVCYIAASFNEWDASNAIEMMPSGENTFTLTLNDVTEAQVAEGFKYLCGRDWAYVEKDASGGEISNRTVATSMDVVESWAKMNNPDIIEHMLTVNGYPRLVKVYLPADYKSSQSAYPVVYMTGVQARYDNAGSDSDRGDDHMGDVSWNIPGMAESVEGGIPCIFVSMYGFVAENIPYAHSDYAGSGAADELIAGIEKELMPYINSKYRTLTGAENTSIMGGDMGGLLSVYAALKRPDLFGQCAALSPTLWINKSELMSYVSTAAVGASQRYYLTVGGGEPEVLQSDVAELQAALALRDNTEVRFTTFAGATHNDVAWGEAFKSVYPYLLSADAADVGSEVASYAPAKQGGTGDLSANSYSILSAIDSQELVYDSNTKFTYITNFVSDGSEVEAQVAIVEIPASVKTKYYWNVSRSADGSGELLKATNGNIGFSSKKTAMTWHRVVVFADESVKDIAAGSHAFRVSTATGDVVMTAGENYTATATVNFGDDKTYEIYYGSVNSGSKQSALTEKLSVSESCTSATIVYDFVTNSVRVSESTTGGGGDDPTTDIANTRYSLVSAIDSQSLTYDANTQFSYITNFVSSGNEVAAQVAITSIPASVKTQYYWNVSRSADGSGELLKATNGNISFSSKKSSTSWHRVAIMEDESVKDVATNSAAFRLATSSESITMSVVNNYSVKATATFTGADKSFTVHYGSVNSGSDMGAITATQQVSSNCTAAEITYDFFTNQVIVNETQWGDAIGEIVVNKMIATPATTRVGESVRVRLEIADSEGCEPVMSVRHNYGNESKPTLTKSGDGAWYFDLSNVQKGIYHITLDLQRGSTTVSDVGTIAVKVLEGKEEESHLVVNAYSNMSSRNQYKSNFHTHTTQSFDAHHRVDVSVDKYYNAGYKILALTDHDANPYPWEMFNLFNPTSENRHPAELDMIAIPGNELSKSYTNSWNEVGGSEFNHHNDFFTGRQGMEFATLRESYAYTEKLGGMQLINHPGQYWSLDKSYKAGEKNSPEWHAENFITYSSLIGLEVYNQGNRRPNDRILWDQILDITMPTRPVWGYSCDDSHNDDQLFRNYNWMLMPSLTVEELKSAMLNGNHYFSYEYSGSGEAKAPRISNIVVDDKKHTITIESDATEIYWISSTEMSNSNAPSTRKSSVIGIGKEFDYSDFQGSYVRALIKNEYGETCTQPFGFSDTKTSSTPSHYINNGIEVYPNPATEVVNIVSSENVERIALYNMVGSCVARYDNCGERATIDVAELQQGHYIVVITTPTTTYQERIIVK